MEVVEVERLFFGRPAYLYRFEGLKIIKERLEALKRVGRVGIGIGDASDDIGTVVQPCRRHDTQRTVRQSSHGCRACGKDHVAKGVPRANEQVDIDILGHIEKSGIDDGIVVIERLLPVECGESELLVAEGRLYQSRISQCITEVNRGEVAQGVAMLQLEHQ